MLTREQNPIYKYRISHSLSTVSMGKLLDPPMHHSNLIKFEQGNRKTITFSVIQRFAKVMNVDSFELQKALVMWRELDQEYDLEELSEDNKL